MNGRLTNLNLSYICILNHELLCTMQNCVIYSTNLICKFIIHKKMCTLRCQFLFGAFLRTLENFRTCCNIILYKTFTISLVPIWDLLMLQLLRPNSSNLPCLYLTFHLEYPLVLSRFCPLINYYNILCVVQLQVCLLTSSTGTIT